ncbi:MAG: hypothetical protein BWY67_00134 [Bacteroidetes bacterium ADurb.Bin397]|nr:MAG: hypothetical protein BWY67_00134 [Bacteroidetes bacterium ADurb.Bin397]
MVMFPEGGTTVENQTVLIVPVADQQPGVAGSPAPLEQLLSPKVTTPVNINSAPQGCSLGSDVFP